MTRDDRLEYSKALNSINRTEFGIMIEKRLVQYPKVYSLMTDIEFDRTTDVKPVHW